MIRIAEPEQIGDEKQSACQPSVLGSSVHEIISHDTTVKKNSETV